MIPLREYDAAVWQSPGFFCWEMFFSVRIVVFACFNIK